MNTVPEGWTSNDIRVVLGEKLIPVVRQFCRDILRDAKKPGFDSNNVAARAKALFTGHADKFEGLEVIPDYLAYFLQHLHNQGKFEELADSLGKPLPKPITLADVLSTDAMTRLQNFVENARSGTLIIEPSKNYLTLVFERVIEPDAAHVKAGEAKHGFTDLHQLAVVVCNVAGIPGYEYPN